MYTFKRQCQEDGNVYLNDNAISIVLNMHGTVGEINDELKKALHYMAGEKINEGYAKDLDDAVNKVKSNEKWRHDYMTLNMRIMEENKITDLAKIVSAIKKGRGRCTDDIIMNMFDLNIEQYDKIISMLDKYPDKDIWELAEMILYNSRLMTPAS